MQEKISPQIEEKKPVVNKIPKFLIILLSIAIVLLVLNLVISFFKNDSKIQLPVSSSKKTSISGTVNLNGSPETGSVIDIEKRNTNQSEFTVILNNLSARDGIGWSINDVIAGANYEIKAVVRQNGVVKGESNIIRVTAPAHEEILSINLSQKDLNGNAIISGSFNINGYIPQGSTITLVAITQGQLKEQIIDDGINPIDQGAWRWEKAEAGEYYILRALLEDKNSQVIAKSKDITVSAPATNEVLTINSTIAPATPQAAVLSGKINLNGQVPDNARIVLLQRVSGTNQYQVALDPINPTDGATWAWNNGSSGVSYDLLAVLKVRQSSGTDKDIAYSQGLTVTAPGVNEILTINTGTTLNAPSQPTVSCDSQNNNQWSITLKGSRTIDANSYWFEIGTQSGGNDMLNSKVSQSDIDPQLKATINNNTTYYARYSYAYCSNCADINYSSFSNTLTFSCPQSPTPQPTSPYTGYVCDSVNGCQLTTNPNPPYAYNNNGLTQCQAACRINPTSTPTPMPTLLPTVTSTPIPTSTPTDIPTPTPTEAPIPTDTPVPIPTDLPQ